MTQAGKATPRKVQYPRSRLVEVHKDLWYYEEDDHIDVYQHWPASVSNVKIPYSALRRTIRRHPGHKKARKP